MFLTFVDVNRLHVLSGDNGLVESNLVGIEWSRGLMYTDLNSYYRTQVRFPAREGFLISVWDR